MKKLLQSVSFILAVGSVPSCFADAYHDGKNALLSKDYSEAALQFGKACDGGDAKGCFDLGAMYENGDGVAQNKYKAVALYTQACQKGDAHGCSNMGLTYDTP